MMVYGKKIELFLVNGTADSLVLAELRNWSGKAIKIPRTEVAGCGRKDFTRPGVYFLFCKAENEDKDAVYIGEAKTSKHVWYSICETHRQGTKNTIGIQPLFLQETIWIRR